MVSSLIILIMNCEIPNILWILCLFLSIFCTIYFNLTPPVWRLMYHHCQKDYLDTGIVRLAMITLSFSNLMVLEPCNSSGVRLRSPFLDLFLILGAFECVVVDYSQMLFGMFTIITVPNKHGRCIDPWCLHKNSLSTCSQFKFHYCA